MRASQDVIREIERLVDEYTRTVDQRQREGILQPNTAHTYQLHASNFVRWCKGEFDPGATKARR